MEAEVAGAAAAEEEDERNKSSSSSSWSSWSVCLKRFGPEVEELESLDLLFRFRPELPDDATAEEEEEELRSCGVWKKGEKVCARRGAGSSGDRLFPRRGGSRYSSRAVFRIPRMEVQNSARWAGRFSIVLSSSRVLGMQSRIRSSILEDRRVEP